MMLIPIVVLGGGTVDYGRTLVQKQQIQSATEAAALAAARPQQATDTERISIAKTVYHTNAARGGISIPDPVVTIGSNSVTVSGGVVVPTPFLKLARIPNLEANGRATAVPSTPMNTEDPGKICLLALDPFSTDGIHLQGANQVNYTGCWAHTNSMKSTAINANGSTARAVGLGHCAVGGYTLTYDTFTPPPTSGCSPVNDPYATVGAYSGGTYTPTFVKPTKASTCTASNLSLKKGTFTLSPGRYCGGIDIKAGATVKFNEGVYYIDNGVFNVQSGSTVTGSNVLFYLAGASARMQVIGGGTTDLSGRTATSTYPGFLVIADAGANPGGESNIQGGGAFKLNGVIYMPTQRIEVSGNGDVNAQGIDVFGMVAKDFYFRGNGVFNTKRFSGHGNVPDIMPTMPVAVGNQLSLR